MQVELVGRFSAVARKAIARVRANPGIAIARQSAASVATSSPTTATANLFQPSSMAMPTESLPVVPPEVMEQMEKPGDSVVAPGASKTPLLLGGAAILGVLYLMFGKKR